MPANKVVLLGFIDLGLNANSHSSTLVPLIQRYRSQYLQFSTGSSDASTEYVNADDVDGGANGINGIVPASSNPTRMRISESGFCAQRFVVSPIFPHETFQASYRHMFHQSIKFPGILRAQICLVFTDIGEWKNHHLEFAEVYANCFHYVTLVSETPSLPPEPSGPVVED